MQHKENKIMAKLSLVEQAMAIPRKDKRIDNISSEEIELALAWLQDLVSLTQCSKVLGHKTPGPTVSRMGILVREAYRKGLLKIK